MSNARVSWHIIAGVVGWLTASAYALAQEPEAPRPPGEGVLCQWALLLVVAEVAARCEIGQDASTTAALESALARVEQYVVDNSQPPMTASDIQTFKRLQGSVGAPRDHVCRPDALQLHQAFVSLGPTVLGQHVDSLLARPGPPTWGVCF